MSKKKQQEVTSIDFLDWAKHKPKKKQAVPKRKLKYPIFKTLADQLPEDEEEWTSILTACANGNFPDYFSVEKNYLIFQDDDQTERIFLKKIDLTGCLDFFKKSAQFSDSELESESEPEPEDPPVERTWDSINVNNKTHLIYVFCNQEKTRLNLNRSEVKLLRSVLNNAYHMKLLSDQNVKLEKRVIAEIDGLIWDPEQRSFHFEKLDLTKKIPSKTKKVTGAVVNKEKDIYPNLQKNWEKMVKIWEGKYLVKERRRPGRGSGRASGRSGQSKGSSGQSTGRGYGSDDLSGGRSSIKSKLRKSDSKTSSRFSSSGFTSEDESSQFD